MHQGAARGGHRLRLYYGHEVCNDKLFNRIFFFFYCIHLYFYKTSSRIENLILSRQTNPQQGGTNLLGGCCNWVEIYHKLLKMCRQEWSSIKYFVVKQLVTAQSKLCPGFICFVFSSLCFVTLLRTKYISCTIEPNYVFCMRQI